MTYLLNASVGTAFVVTLGCVAAGCASSSTQANASPSVEGRYSVTVTRSAASCAPQPLPSPTNADTTQYAQVPAQGASSQGAFKVELTNATISVIPMSADGSALPALALTGLYSATDPVVLTLASSRTEGPRSGGHVYSVAESNTDTAQFVRVVQTPPGTQLESHLASQGNVTLIFRDGGPSGPVYTTCVYAETIYGIRIAQ